MSGTVTSSDAPLVRDLTNGYADFAAFADAHPSMDYYRFDWSSVHELNLFALRETFDFDEVDRMSDLLTDALPSVKRILAHPTLYLKVTEEIVPVESVQIINNRTLEHATVHSELWENLTDDQRLIPRRLLTLKNQDDYAIYENVALTWLLFRVLSWLRRNISLCKDLLYADRVLDMNVLGRYDHLYHHLAVGKIHTGYIRGFDKLRDVTERSLNRLMYLYNTLAGRMGCPLVTACRPHVSRFKLHKSNLFRMHRDYHTVFKLCKAFAQSGDTADDSDDLPRDGTGEGYRIFVNALSIFAAGHFNFTCAPEAHFSLYTPDIGFSFLDWTLRLSDVILPDETGALLMTVAKDTEYRILMIPVQWADGNMENLKNKYDAIRSAVSVDEYVVLSDEASDEIDKAGIPKKRVSLSDIESFRRIQQLLLRGMVCADRTFSDCPFCGHGLLPEETAGDTVMSCTCPSCRTRIRRRVCPETGKAYMTTDIAVPEFTGSVLSADTVRKSTWVYDRIAESSMHFRNITRITASCDIICPHCGKVHI